MGQIGNLKPRFNLYTVPSQSIYRSTRRLVLKNVDGIVFVADSQRSRMADNARAFHEMKSHLYSLGYQWFELPLVLQYNKQDMPGRVSETTLQRRLSPDDTLPYLGSVATEGVGVIETLKQIIGLVLLEIQQRA